MTKPREKVVELATKLIDSETDTRAGKLNTYLLTAAFVLILGGTALDVVQAAVRIFRPDYHSGLPPLVPLFIVFVAGGLVCVYIVARFDPRA